jgi:hypothetical protein
MNKRNEVIRLDLAHVRQILENSKLCGHPLPLWNNLRGTLYRLDCPKIAMIAKACEKPVLPEEFGGRFSLGASISPSEAEKHYVLAVSVRDENVYLIFQQSIDPDYIVVMAHLHGRVLYDKVLLVGYENTAYYAGQKTGQLLINAVKHRRKPSIEALLDCKTK